MAILLLYVLYAIGLSVALGRAGYQSPESPSVEATSPPPTRILIVGATGATGRHLVTEALARGYRVTALARHPAALDIDHAHLTIVRGDVLDAASVDAAMRGQEAVLSALGHSRYLGPTRILSAGTRTLVQAMEAHGVRRLICMSSLGLGDSAGRMGLYYTLLVIPLVLPFYFWDKTRQERIVASSAVDWTIIRPAALTNGVRRGRVRHGTGTGIGSYLWTLRISRADVAAFMLDQLAADDYRHTAVSVA